MNRAERRKASKTGVSNKAIMDRTLSDTYESGYKAGMKAVTEIVFYMTAHSIQMEFGLGRKRLQRAMKRIFNNIDAFRTGHLTPNDYDTIVAEMNEMGIKIE